LRGIVRPGDTFAAVMCNPPFHASPAAAAAGTLRKLRNLGGLRAERPVLNFGGQSHELWCEGGEAAFARQLIVESSEFPDVCAWFTTLVSKRDNLPVLYQSLKRAGVAEFRTIELRHGQKASRILAWRFDRKNRPR
jgi:23S rRNA (adenine1618-N6)-methyltransferase